MPVRVLMLLLTIAALSGCRFSFVTSPTSTPAVFSSPVVRELPTAGHTPAPTSAPVPPSLTPAERPTAPATAAPSPNAAPAPPSSLFSYPIGVPGEPLGDGFFIRDGAEVENTWYNPGYWHTGEDWYAVAGDTAGAHVYAIADGAVVYVGGNYPGRVVIFGTRATCIRCTATSTRV